MAVSGEEGARWAFSRPPPSSGVALEGDGEQWLGLQVRWVGCGCCSLGAQAFQVQLPPRPSGLLPSLFHTPAASARPSQECW